MATCLQLVALLCVSTGLWIGADVSLQLLFPLYVKSDIILVAKVDV